MAETLTASCLHMLKSQHGTETPHHRFPWSMYAALTFPIYELLSIRMLIRDSSEVFKTRTPKFQSRLPCLLHPQIASESTPVPPQANLNSREGLFWILSILKREANHDRVGEVRVDFPLIFVSVDLGCCRCGHAPFSEVWKQSITAEKGW